MGHGGLNLAYSGGPFSSMERSVVATLHEMHSNVSSLKANGYRHYQSPAQDLPELPEKIGTSGRSGPTDEPRNDETPEQAKLYEPIPRHVRQTSTWLNNSSIEISGSRLIHQGIGCQGR